VTEGVFLSGCAVAQGVLFFFVIFASAITDVWQRKVPNPVCAVGLIGGLMLSYLRGGLEGGPVSLYSSLGCAGAGFFIFFLFYLIGGLGAGDVKLITALGALAADWGLLKWVIIYTAIFGIPLALIALWRGKALRRGVLKSVGGMLRWRYKRNVTKPDVNDSSEITDNAEESITIPYALAICFGAVAGVAQLLAQGRALPFL
jgi:prepilin peptidase CpaA